MSERIDFDRLLREYRAPLSRLASAYAVSPGDRDDLLQDILVALWQAMRRFRGECSERTFVYRVAHNRAISYAMRHRALAPLDETVDIPAPGPDPMVLAARSERQARLLEAIRQLSPLLRETVLLKLEGLSDQEIAQVLGAIENTVAVRLSRARKALKAVLRDLEAPR